MLSLSSNSTLSFISIIAQIIQKEFRTKDANNVSKSYVIGGIFEINIMRPMFSYRTYYKSGLIKIYKTGNNAEGIEKIHT